MKAHQAFGLVFLSLSFAVVLVFQSRQRQAEMPRTSHAGVSIMSMSPTDQKHTFQHVVRPAAVGGKYYEMKEFVAAGIPGAIKGKPGSPMPHIHPHQVEDFEVLQGTFAYSIEGVSGMVATGGKATIPAGKSHHFWNPSRTEDLLIRVRLTPGLRSDEFFDNMVGVVRDAAARGKEAHPLQMIGLCKEYDLIPADIPAPLRAPLMTFVHAVARVFGYKYSYDIYGGALSEQSAGSAASPESAPQSTPDADARSEL